MKQPQVNVDKTSAAEVHQQHCPPTREPEHPVLQFQAARGNRATHQAIADRSLSGIAERSAPPAPSFRGLSQELFAGRGQPLPDPVRQQMEFAFGTDFSEIRVHKGRAATELNAEALTDGKNIGVAPGYANFETPDGKKRLGHELAHVVQQRSRRVPTPSGSDLSLNSDPRLEAEAEAMGAKAALAEPVQMASQHVSSQPSTTPATGGAIQRKPLKDLRYKLGNKYGIKLGESGRRGAQDRRNPPPIQIIPVNQPALAQNQPQRQSSLANLPPIDIGRHLEGIERKEGRAKTPRQITDEVLQKYAEDYPHLLEEGPKNEMYSVFHEELIHSITKEGGTDFIDKNLVPGQQGKQASGNMATVSRLVYDTPEGRKVGFFKPLLEPSQKAYTASVQGIPQKSDQAARAVAASRIDQLLGTDILTQTEFAAHNNQIGSVSEAAPGASPKLNLVTYDRSIDYGNAQTRRDLSTLQVLDAIIGQLDRHPGNYFIDKETGKVTGIDNDLAFGEKSNEAFVEGRTDQGTLGVPGIGKGRWQSHFKGLPSFVDKAVKDSINRVSSNQVRNVLTGLLTNAEIEATIARFEHVKRKLKDLGEVTDLEQWAIIGEDLLKKNLDKPTKANSAKSYFGQVVDATNAP
ncbi:eCIS core domain-containing protein [Myxacorys almedinensis]|uniref:DUF4157 domain-containing protein n=1 Tax=Myxacorys almedinensis A TaxID=2690445 RepID=A0A8J8CIG3_9CYAN|nr:DUF4157 domain-containing protein [Myxacorys almedinensis]NDJ16476.1 DUF4157 domain-containing protein [Myxacorys almedinensis A]